MHDTALNAFELEALLPITSAPDTDLIREGESCTRTVSYSAASIAAFAELCGDKTPLHFADEAASRARHGQIIASGQQTASQMMGLVASHFSRDDDGLAREMLCLNFNFSFKAPVFADQPLLLRWQVGRVEFNPKLGGYVGELQGSATSGPDVTCVVGRGTVLLKAAKTGADSANDAVA